MANSSSAFSTSACVSVCDLRSWFARSICVFAIVRRAFAAASAASVCATPLRGVRLSISTSSVPASTTSPISACTASTSPDAFDFTSTIDSGSMIPAASTVTSMLRVSTGAESYKGATDSGVDLLHAASAASAARTVGTANDVTHSQ